MPMTTITLPPDVAARLDTIARLTGLPHRDAARVLLTLLLRPQPPVPSTAEEGNRHD